MDDLCQTQQPGIFQVIFQYDRLKRTPTLVMTEFYTGRVEGDRASFFCDFLDLIFRHKYKLGLAVNKTCDQPGTSYTVNMDMRAGDPFHGELLSVVATMLPQGLRPYGSFENHGGQRPPLSEAGYKNSIPYTPAARTMTATAHLDLDRKRAINATLKMIQA